ncbi:CD63 antigen [Copidosoma floridanum]|uniref:CD63 antigen n=1 Tax=Copidosoma floridanum TaxID=29053 RepID=UPI0006C9CB8B|nr:CD63 antigen [Copidosoma floridanum]
MAAPVTHLDVGMRCIKCLLCAVNFVFVLTGILILSMSRVIYDIYNNFSYFLDSSYFSPATVLVTVGVFIIIVASLGCYGALKESTFLVLAFAFALSVVLVLEFAAAIAAYVLQADIVALLNDKINRTMHQYDDNLDAKAAIDSLQYNLQCCGYNGPSDWVDVGLRTSHVYNAPDSCYWHCHADNGGPFSYQCADPEGCHEKLAHLVNCSAAYLITGATMIALIQVAGIMFACKLGRAIRKQKTLREMRRWQMRASLLNGYVPLGKTDPTSTYPVVYMKT